MVHSLTFVTFIVGIRLIDGDVPASNCYPGLDTVIGIDLGFTHSCVAVMQNGQVEIILDGRGNRITPNYVAFTTDGHLVGEDAKDQFAKNPYNTIFDVTRFIGRNFSDSTVQKDRKLLPFSIVNEGGSQPLALPSTE